MGIELGKLPVDRGVKEGLFHRQIRQGEPLLHAVDAQNWSMCGGCQSWGSNSNREAISSVCGEMNVGLMQRMRHALEASRSGSGLSGQLTAKFERLQPA